MVQPGVARLVMVIASGGRSVDEPTGLGEVSALEAVVVGLGLGLAFGVGRSLWRRRQGS